MEGASAKNETLGQMVRLKLRKIVDTVSGDSEGIFVRNNDGQDFLEKEVGVVGRRADGEDVGPVVKKEPSDTASNLSEAEERNYCESKKSRIPTIKMEHQHRLLKTTQPLIDKTLNRSASQDPDGHLLDDHSMVPVSSQAVQHTVIPRSSHTVPTSSSSSVPLRDERYVAVDEPSSHQHLIDLSSNLRPIPPIQQPIIEHDLQRVETPETLQSGDIDSIEVPPAVGRPQIPLSAPAFDPSFTEVTSHALALSKFERGRRKYRGTVTLDASMASQLPGKDSTHDSHLVNDQHNNPGVLENQKGYRDTAFETAVHALESRDPFGGSYMDGRQSSAQHAVSHQVAPSAVPQSALGIEKLIMELEQKRKEKANALHVAQQRHQSMARDFNQGRLNMESSIPMMPLQGQFGSQLQTYFGQQCVDPRHPTYTPQQFGQMQSNMEQALLPPQDFNSFNYSSMHPASHSDCAQNSHTAQFSPLVQQGVVEKSAHSRGKGTSDDDESLRKHVKRNPSVLSGSSNSPQSLTVSIPTQRHQVQSVTSDSDFEIVAVKHKSGDPKQMQRHMPQPLDRATIVNERTAELEEHEEFDYSLPKYEVQRQPLEKGEDIHSAKVSLPGMVREELFLSPDHADQEVHLLMNVFIPAHQALTLEEAEPAKALLNFHTIAIMVIEAYVQFEIGDEFGTGRGHWHQTYDDGDEDYARLRDAKDANVEDIFFAVIDRWRAGLESNKKPLQLIRGVQEFCDIALDIIHYIKEHGLCRTEPEPRRPRADKGVKRGAQKATAKLTPRKKPKTEKPTPAKPKAKSKATFSAVTVVKRGRN